MTQQYYSFTDSELIERLNLVKQLVLTALEKDGLLTDAEKWGETFAVDLVHKGKFGSWVDRLLGLKDSTSKIIIVKIIK